MTLCLLPQSSWAQNVSLDSLLTVAREIKVIAQQYLDDKGDTKTSADMLVAQYGRSSQYNSDQWTAIAGNVPADFKALVSTDYATFPKINLVDLPNGDQLEAAHFWAAVNASYMGNGDLGGWGGDLVQLAQDIHSNAETTFPSSRFSREDWVSDADAYILYNNYPDDILAGMEQYYRPELTEAERVSSFYDGKSIATRFTTSPNYMLLYMLMYSYKVTQTDLNQAIDIFQAYIDSYLEEPEEPEEPEDPNVDPEEPNEPNVDPEEPNDPEEPEEPNNPDQPEEPDDPEEPEGPNNPDQPEDPNDPEEPEGPNNPDQPEDPDQPDQPEDPEGNQQSLPSLTITSKAAQTYTPDGRAATPSSHLRIQGHHIIWQ